MVITLNMIVRDEEHTLPVCLRSVRDWVDEIIVVDTGSIDGTVDIATAYGATVAHFAWCDDFSAARNFALAQVKTPWVFWLDADDMVLNPELLPELVQDAHKQRCDGIWSIYQQDGASYQRRMHLFKPRHYQWQGVVHETPQSKRPHVESHYLSDLVVLHRKPPERAPEAARNYLRILLEKDPDNDLGIAESYKFLGERLLAEAHYWQALEHPRLNDPTRYLCLYNVARLNLEHAIEEPQRLSLAYKQAAIGVVLAPHRAECLVIQGQAAEAMGELAEAKRCYTEALTKEMPHDDVGLVYHEYYEKIPRLLLAALEKRSLCEL